MMTNDEKVKVNRMRRMAERQGLTLRKKRRLDPYAPDYGTFTLVDHRDKILARCNQVSLDQIEKFLKRARS